MSDLNEMVNRIKQCDQQWQQLFDFKKNHPKREAINEAIQLCQDVDQVVKQEPNVKEVMKNEELIDLYFNRFLVSDRTTGEDIDGFYLKGKEKCKQMSEQLFGTMADITSDGADHTFDVKTTSEILVKATQELKAKTLQSMAENDIKIYESKQMANKLGLNWTDVENDSK